MSHIIGSLKETQTHTEVAKRKKTGRRRRSQEKTVTKHNREALNVRQKQKGDFTLEYSGISAGVRVRSHNIFGISFV